MTADSARAILKFWFEEISRERWFRSSPEFDEEIRNRFEALWHDARDGKCAHWLSSKNGALALILLLDQFPRNMFRGTAQAFATDGLAREAAREALAKGYDLQAAADERNFLYLPFMHSEDLADQDLCVRLCRERLGADHTASAYALRHRAAIERFGRFPARNEALGRATTEAEADYLKDHPSGF
jgi:uncharacterized protein (DUF924 family)